MRKEQKRIVAKGAQSALHFSASLCWLLCRVIERKGETGFPVPHIPFFNPIGFRNHEVMDTEMKLAGMDFRGIRIGKNCFEANTEFPNTGMVITFGAISKTGYGFNVLS